MRIVFRLSGNNRPALEIKRVDYFEPLPKRMQFTAVGYEGVQEIESNKNGFVWEGVTYDFLEVFDN